jgi:hypothetical protein
MFGRRKSASHEQRIENPLLFAVRSKDPNGPMTVHIDPSQVANGHEAGLILADFAAHFAKALTMTGTAESEAVAISEIRALFDAELDAPTMPVRGGINSTPEDN